MTQRRILRRPGAWTAILYFGGNAVHDDVMTQAEAIQAYRTFLAGLEPPAS